MAWSGERGLRALEAGRRQLADEHPAGRLEERGRPSLPLDDRDEVGLVEQ